MFFKKLFISLFFFAILNNYNLSAEEQTNEVDTELIGERNNGEVQTINVETEDGVDNIIVKKQKTNLKNIQNNYNDEFYDNFKVVDTKSQKINKKVSFDIKVSNPQDTQSGSSILNLQKAYGCYKEQDYELAVNYYKNALQDNPESVEALFGLGVSYQLLHQYDQAIESYLQLFSKNYSRKKIVNNLLMCLKHKSYKDALDILLSIDQKIDGYSDILSQIGLIYMKTGDNIKALSALNKAYELSPMNAIISYNLAILYDIEGNVDYAKHFFDLAIKNDIVDYLSAEEVKQLEKKIEEIDKRIMDEIQKNKGKK